MASYKNKKWFYVEIALYILGLLGLCTCIVVDTSINGSMTWSTIISYSIIFIYLMVFVILRSNSKKLRNGLITLSIIIIPYLYLIQYQLTRLYQVPMWLWRYGIPITCVWLVVLWLAILINKRGQTGWLHSILVLGILALPASALTVIISNRSVNIEIFIIIMIIAAMLLFLLHSTHSNKLKENKMHKING